MAGMTAKVALGEPRPKSWPKPIDSRPWLVVDSEGSVVGRCWYRETAQALAKMKGPGCKATKK